MSVCLYEYGLIKETNLFLFQMRDEKNTLKADIDEG